MPKNGDEKSTSRSISAPFSFWDTADFFCEYYETSLSELVREAFYLWVSVQHSKDPEWRFKLKQKAKNITNA